MPCKTLYFKTKLSKPQIEAVLKSSTLKWNYSSLTTGNVFISKWSRKRFYLTKTTKYGLLGRAVIPFAGKILEREDGSVIAGRFALPTASRVFIGCFLGFVWVMVLSNAVRWNFNMKSTWFSLLALGFWTLYVSLLPEVLGRFFFETEKEEVLQFLQTRLAAEPAETENL